MDGRRTPTGADAGEGGGGEPPWDHVVVGGGSAGCVLAHRLSADPSRRVLLLEAGPEDRSPWIRVPLGYGKLFADRRHNWMFETEPEPGLGGRRVFQPRGKVLGGSSAINGLLYVRGQPEDFAHWRQLGLPGWGWEDVLPAFRRAEDNARGACAHHGAGGPLAVSDQADPHPLSDAFVAAAVEAGFARNPDFNGAAQEGVGYYQVTARRGRRVSAAHGYLTPAVRARPNLRVETGALARRVLFEGRRAVGVAWRRGGPGGPEVVARAREVVLCAGAFGTPQLLQVSGVGPAAHLRDRLGVPVVADLPGVGANLEDHPQVRAVFRCTRAVTVNDALRNPARAALAALRWAALGRGPLALSAGHAGGFFRTDPARVATPDVQALLIPFSTDRMGTRLHPFPGFIASVCMLRAESRGTVMARTADADDAPEIRANYLSAERDRRTMLDGLRLLLGILDRPAMRPWVAERLLPAPGAEADEAALAAFLRENVGSIYHPTGTARMGPDGDAGAVLDARLRVRGGVGGLRVADASAFPATVSGNTNAAAVMLGERAAEIAFAEGR